MTALAWIENDDSDEHAAPAARPRLRVVGDEDERRRKRVVDAIVAEGLEPLQRMAMRWAGRALEVDDLVQDTVERALRAADRFDEAGNLQGWLRTIMYHVAVDRSRRRARRGVETDVERVAAPEPDPTADWERLTVAEVRAAARRLSAPLQAAYRLHHEENLSYEQMSRRLGVPLGTVATRLHRARLQIRRHLEAGLVDAHGEGAISC
jgi:RNA polymerase sigma-70 factor (ECF subfamily)